MDKLLIIEDDEGIQTQLKWGLADRYEVLTAGSRKDALNVIDAARPRVMTLDLGLPPHEDGATEGLACLQEILGQEPLTKVIVITGNESRDAALKAISLGAYDFYQKPIDIQVLKVVLERAFKLFQLEVENEALRQQMIESHSFEHMLGHCSGMQEVFQTIKKVASTEATVLITGESGTGKELVAKAIHYRSLRKDKPLVAINCGGIPDNLLESELFGYEKGAFTDARSRKIGLIEKASGGTLFLDEIGELPGPLQVKLLRVLQERKIQRLGGTESIDVDMRIIAATNRDLQSMVAEAKFREDLFYRLSVIQVPLPSLKDRDDDILLLARHFLNRFSRENNRRFKGFSGDAIAAIQRHDWPGNVRELENKIQRAVIMAEGSAIKAEDLTLDVLSAPNPSNLWSAKAVMTLRDARAQAEMEVIQKALLVCEGNISRAAKELELSRPTLHALIKKYDIEVSLPP